jgi:hypothetical protein
MSLRHYLPAPLALVLLPLGLLGVALIVLSRRRRSLDS